MQKRFVISETGNKKPSRFHNKDTNKLTSIASITDDRERSACTVFEDKIVVSRGSRREAIPNRVYPGSMVDNCLRQRLIHLNSIEAYDYYDNKWSCLSYMLSSRINHTAISINNKMIIFRGSSDYSEVFDSITRKLTYIKTLPNWTETSELVYYRRINYPYQVVGIANKIYFFRMIYKKVDVNSYDVRNNFFTYKTSIETETFKKFCCVKIPMI